MSEEMEQAQAGAETPPEAEAPQQPADPLDAERAAHQAEVTSLKEGLALAVSRYRAQLLASAPEVPEEMVAGDTVEAVDAAFSAARDLVERVRLKLESSASGGAGVRVPAGAPPRTADLSALSPRDKIAYALSRQER